MFADLPLFTDLHEQGGDQPETRGLIWENTHDLGSSTNLFVDPLQTVGGTGRAPVFERKVKYSESFSQVLLHPGG